MSRLLPWVGDLLESKAMPNLRAAHLIEAWLELRSLLASDVRDDRDHWQSDELSAYMGIEKRDATYPSKLRKTLMGDKDQYRSPVLRDAC